MSFRGMWKEGQQEFAPVAAASERTACNILRECAKIRIQPVRAVHLGQKSRSLARVGIPCAFHGGLRGRAHDQGGI